MADYFKQALRGEGLVFVSNSVMSPALRHGDGWFLTPLIHDEEYIPFLLEKCRALEIGLLVSLFDIDLPVLAAHRADFAAAGTLVAVSDPDTIACCNDKYEMYRTLSGAGIGCPETWLETGAVPEDAGWPLVVKPRFGMGSLGLHRSYTAKELETDCGKCGREIRETYLRYEAAAVPGRAVVIQKLCRGQEYGLDVVCDLGGSYVTTIVRKKLAMRSGETDEAVILGAGEPGYGALAALGGAIAGVLKPRGLIDVDVMMEEGAAPCVIDINARFGGGYPFSHLAGADVPRAYVCWMQGLEEEAKKACTGAVPGVHGYKDISIMRMETGGTYA